MAIERVTAHQGSTVIESGSTVVLWLHVVEFLHRVPGKLVR